MRQRKQQKDEYNRCALSEHTLLVCDVYIGSKRISLNVQLYVLRNCCCCCVLLEHAYVHRGEYKHCAARWYINGRQVWRIGANAYNFHLLWSYCFAMDWIHFNISTLRTASSSLMAGIRVCYFVVLVSGYNVYSIEYETMRKIQTQIHKDKCLRAWSWTTSEWLCKWKFMYTNIRVERRESYT